uniref:Uncharacterized protein n=1 Tax=Anguilla anguilla TaxID=7936 RepID=A0A0E9VCL4_ANGAN
MHFSASALRGKPTKRMEVMHFNGETAHSKMLANNHDHNEDNIKNDKSVMWIMFEDHLLLQIFFP